MEKCIICILDILGTKGIWTEQKNIEKYFEVLDKVEKLLSEGKSHFDSLAKEQSYKFEYFTFSDSLVIMLINEDSTNIRASHFFEEAINGFSQVVLGVFDSYFAHSFFARGAISFGDVARKGNRFVGPAVDDAAEFFELQDMIGICFTPKTTFAMDYAIDWNQRYFNRKVDDFVVKHKTPLKNKLEYELYQINYPKYHYILSQKENSESDALGTFSMFLSKRNIPINAMSKFANTVVFFNQSINKYQNEINKAQ